jgi:hypothetical protein
MGISESFTLISRRAEVAASLSMRRGVQMIEVSAGRRPPGAKEGSCVNSHRTELGMNRRAAALGLGAGLTSRLSNGGVSLRCRVKVIAGAAP